MKSILNVVRFVTVLALSATVSLHAADEKKKGPASLADRTIKKYESVGLTEEQTAKIKELAAPAEAKIAEVNAKAALSDEQKAARKDAEKAAKDAGKTGKEARESIDAALNLSADQKAAKAEAAKVNAEFNKAVSALLTDDQKAKLPKPAGGKAKKPADS